MDSIFIVDTYKLSVKEVFLDSVTDEEIQLINLARQVGRVIGNVDNNLLILIQDIKGLSITIDNHNYQGAFFIVASDMSLTTSTIRHIQLFERIRFHINPTYELLKLIRGNRLKLRDEVRLPFSSQTITCKEFIMDSVDKNLKFKKMIFILSFKANSEYVEDSRDTLYTLMQKVYS